MNEYLRGWGTYYGRGNSTTVFHDLDRFTRKRIARFVSKKHGRSGVGYGFYVLGRSGSLGLHALVGTVRYGPAHASSAKGWG